MTEAEKAFGVFKDKLYDEMVEWCEKRGVASDLYEKEHHETNLERTWKEAIEWHQNYIWEKAKNNARESITDQEYLFLSDIKELCK